MPRVYCIRPFNFEIIFVVETDGITKQFSFNFKETFSRSFVSLFKYCDLCNNSTSHQLVLKQVPCTALMITNLSTLEVMSLVGLTQNKNLLWTQNAVSSLTSVQAHSKQISVYQEIVTSFRSRKPSGLYRVNSPRLYVFQKVQFRVRENLSSQYARCTVKRIDVFGLNTTLVNIEPISIRFEAIYSQKKLNRTSRNQLGLTVKKLILLMLLLGRDIQLNLGPNQRYPCGVCNQLVKKSERYPV